MIEHKLIGTTDQSNVTPTSTSTEENDVDSLTEPLGRAAHHDAVMRIGF